MADVPAELPLEKSADHDGVLHLKVRQHYSSERMTLTHEINATHWKNDTVKMIIAFPCHWKQDKWLLEMHAQISTNPDKVKKLIKFYRNY